jgi:hypothetical protein
VFDHCDRPQVVLESGRHETTTISVDSRRRNCIRSGAARLRNHYLNRFLTIAAALFGCISGTQAGAFPQSDSGTTLEVFRTEASSSPQSSSSDSHHGKSLRPAETGGEQPALQVFQGDDSPYPPKSPSDLEHAKSLVRSIAAGGQTRLQLLSRSPDVELKAFRHGSKYPELYSVWFDEGLVYPGSYSQALTLWQTRDAKHAKAEVEAYKKRFPQLGLETFQTENSPFPPRSYSDMEHAKSLVGGIELGGLTTLQLLSHPPDVELQAFRLGSAYPELYSIWFDSGIVYPGSYQQALRLGLTRHPLTVFKALH